MAFFPEGRSEVVFSPEVGRNMPPLPPVNLEGIKVVGQTDVTTGSLREVTIYVGGVYEHLGTPQYEDTLSKAPETVVVRRSVRPVRVISIPPGRTLV